MDVEFSKAKDNSNTFCVNGVLFHSAYSPEKEAQRFADSLAFQNNPEIIFLIEPGFAYCQSYIKQTYNAQLVCIRILDTTLEDEDSWDYVIRYKRELSLSQILIDTFGEEKLLSSAVAIWKPAENIFKDEVSGALQEYSKALETSKTLIVTRQYFEKEWLLNSCNFVNFACNIINDDIKTLLPVVVCASGPSLKICLKTLKQKQNSLFIICLSSATSVLIKNDIMPDLILSTDGGYWAGQHLKALYTNSYIPVAASCESCIPKKILKTNPLLVLKYNDTSSFISNGILEKCGYKTLTVERNATVSGTALSLAKTITNSQIYFCGLDLASGKDYAHTQPNELEKNNCLKDNRIKNLFTRIASSQLNSSSLDIYRNWFSCQTDVEKVFRVIDEDNERLGQIKDISSAEFSNKIQATAGNKKLKIITHKSTIDKKQIFKYIKDELNSDRWKKQIFPADYISIKNCNSSSDKQKAQDRLAGKINRLLEKINELENE